MKKKVQNFLLVKRKKTKLKFILGELVGIADMKNVFSKGHRTSWSYKVCTITEINIETIASHHITNSPEGYIEKLLRKPDLKMEEYRKVFFKEKSIYLLNLIAGCSSRLIDTFD